MSSLLDPDESPRWLCLSDRGGKPRHTKHGHTSGRQRTRAYHSWSAMRRRCLNPQNSHYPNYGGRGIAVCERWLDFGNFLADMGEPPEGHTLDRLDNDGNYEPGNCRWASRAEQNDNRRARHLLTCDGITDTVKGWVRRTGMPKSTLLTRLARGWTVEQALTTPHGPDRPRHPDDRRRADHAA